MNTEELFRQFTGQSMSVNEAFHLLKSLGHSHEDLMSAWESVMLEPGYTMTQRANGNSNDAVAREVGDLFIRWDK